MRRAGYKDMHAKGVPLSVEGIRKGYLFCKNGMLKGKRLDLRVEPPRIKLCRVHAWAQSPSTNLVRRFSFVA